MLHATLCTALAVFPSPQVDEGHGHVVDPFGAPVEGASVHVFENPGPGDRLLTTVETDEEGRFRFEFFPQPGAFAGFRIVAVHPDHALWGGHYRPDDPQSFGVILSEKTTLRGQILDAAGAPLAGAHLEPHYFGQFAKGFVVPAPLNTKWSATTDADGRYEIANLPRGAPARLQVRAGGHAMKQLHTVLADDPESTAETLQLNEGAEIRGRLVYEGSGEPAAGVRIHAQAHGHAVESWGEAVTDAEGRYSLPHLDAATWNVLVMLSDWAQEHWTASALTVTLAPGQVLEDQVLRMEKGAEVVFRTVDRADGSPAPFVSIGLYDPARPDSGGAIHRLATDGAGVCSLRVPPGSARAYLSGLGEGFLRGQMRGGFRLLTVEAGQRYEVVFDLDRAATLRGVLVGPDGRPVEGATVLRAGSSRRGANRNLSASAVVSDATGHFVLSGFEPGSPMEVRVSRGRVGTPQLKSFPPPEEGFLEVALKLEESPVDALHGWVLDPEGRPVPGARVQLEELFPDGTTAPTLDFGRRLDVSADGSYAFDGIWPGNEYRLTATRSVRDEDGNWSTTEAQSALLKADEGILKVPALILPIDHNP